jgi:hypothetical protein
MRARRLRERRPSARTDGAEGERLEARKAAGLALWREFGRLHVQIVTN